MAKKTYTVLSAVEHDGKRVESGKTISLEDEAAQPLLDVKAIAEPEAEPAEAKKGK